MNTTDLAPVLAGLFAELIDGLPSEPGGFVLNPGDAGLLRSLDTLTAEQASRAIDGGATIAAHAAHLRYSLSLMNRWARDGGNPFADARWEEAWRTSTVDADAWQQTRAGLRDEAHRWREALKTPRDADGIELSGMAGSVVHLAYHLGAIRQIAREARGPKAGTT